LFALEAKNVLGLHFEAMSSTETHPDWRAIVGKFVDDGRRTVGNGEALAQELEKLGVGGDKGGRYSMSAISNWVKGRTMPPADVLLAVAMVSNQSLDGLVPGRAAGAAADGEDVGQLKTELARLQAEMMHLYSRVGEPYDREDAAANDSGGLPRTGTNNS
jgi:transcriptional regulator with XRE-family HTH domain